VKNVYLDCECYWIMRWCTFHYYALYSQQLETDIMRQEAVTSLVACCLLGWLSIKQDWRQKEREVEKVSENSKIEFEIPWNSTNYCRYSQSSQQQHHNINITIINRSYSTLFIRYTLLQWSIYNKTSSSAASEYLPLQRKVKYCLPLYTRKLVKHCLPATGADEETSKVKTTRKLL